MGTNIDKYMDRIKQIAYKGAGMYEIENSLYQAGSKKALLILSEPNTVHYFFSLNCSYFEECDEVLFVCGNDLCAFKIPKTVLNELPFSTKGNGRRKTTIYFDHSSASWYLTFNKDKDGYTKMCIDGYMISLKTNYEVAIEALGLRKMLGIN